MCVFLLGVRGGGCQKVWGWGGSGKCGVSSLAARGMLVHAADSPPPPFLSPHTLRAVKGILAPPSASRSQLNKPPRSSPPSKICTRLQSLRAVKGILNKLTPEKYERLLGQLLEVVTTADLLKQTISLVFENAVAQPTFCAM